MQRFSLQDGFFSQQPFKVADIRGSSIIKSAHPFVLLSNHSQLERKRAPVTVKGLRFETAKMS